MMSTKKIAPILFLLTLALSVSASTRGVLGKLGQTVERAAIQAAPSAGSRVYYKAQAFEYLIVNPAKTSNWLKVKLKNGRDGYIQKKSVAQLPYDVAATRNGGGNSAPSGGPISKEMIPGYALQYKGTPYVWGGNSLKGGIDCSGFVKELFGKIGVNLPRTASEQALVGQSIKNVEDLQPGDRLYFWETKRNKIGHTGIYMGNGYFVHSSRGKGGVDTDYLTEKWRKTLVAARR